MKYFSMFSVDYSKRDLWVQLLKFNFRCLFSLHIIWTTCNMEFVGLPVGWRVQLFWFLTFQGEL